MSKYQTYSEYKISDDELVGDIPVDWDLWKWKHMMSHPMMYGANEAALDDDRSNPRYIRITDMNSDGSLRDDTFRSLPLPVAEDYLLEDGDILVARTGATVGKSFLYKSEFGTSCFAGYLIRARINKRISNSRFVYWFLQSDQYWNYISGSQIQATIQNVSAEKYGDLKLPVPNNPQHALTIANFLDHETAKIDTLIEKQQQLIKLLKEKRQAVISHAVTKGLNPNAPMRDSGVEWLGEVPEHWVVGRYKFCTSRIVVGIAEAATHAYAENGVPIIRSTNITEEGLNSDGMLFIKESFAEGNESKYLYANDVVTVRTGYPGISAVIPEFLNRSQCFTNLVATPKRGISSEFLAEYLNSHTGKSYFALLGWGSAQKNISVPILQNVPIAIPPEDEQSEIAAFIQKKRSGYKKILDKAELQIELLKERRTALISAAVTGKIDVRNWQPPVDSSANHSNEPLQEATP